MKKRVIYILTIFIIMITALLGCAKEKSAQTADCEAYTFSISSDELFEGKVSDEEMGDYTIYLSAEISEFSGLSLGKSGENGTSLRIDKDSIYVYRENDPVFEEELKIDIKDNIEILLNNDLKNKAEIKIMSGENVQLIKDVPWSARWGKLFVKTDADTSLKNCSLTYSCNGWHKPIWLFGDSYFNCASESRWTSYLTLYGCDNFLLNGYPGRKSDAALESLKNMLKYDTPDEVIWCMGMNDGDSENEINDSWKKDVKEVINICEANDIKLILSTIPDCPQVNNGYKNQYVKESGYKYIDFANAVGAYENTEWYSGMLEEGEVRIHPTKEGAEALYKEAVASCPELLR